MAMPLPIEESLNLNWRKAMRSVNAGACAEVASAAGTVLVRDSKDAGGLVLRYPANSWSAFLGAARTGSFDRIG
jgi:hypothetical protein